MSADAADSRWRCAPLVVALLVVVTFAVYWPARHYDFVNHDDPVYVYENPHVLHGLSWEGVTWAFGRLSGVHTYWHPVTWLSLMLDTQLFGPGAGPRHLVNVSLHALNAVLLFLLLRRMTGAVWRSAAVAALFAWHPLQVDSVAWITERKNVLSTFFWLGTMWAYVAYVSRVEPRREASQGPGSRLRGSRFLRSPWSWYCLMLASFALGLMAKPMLVTLPLILLLMDFWPLHRFPGSRALAGDPLPSANAGTPSGESTSQASLLTPGTSLLRLCLEKVPLLLLSAASAAITILAHRQLGALASDRMLPLTARLANAAVSYVRYLGKALWPAHLAVHYPHPGTWPTSSVAGATVVLLCLSAWTVREWRRRPYLLAGWLWFLVTLLPTIGLIQASNQAMADRFAYVPLIGLFLLLVWLLAELTAGSRQLAVVNSLLAGALLAACLTATRLQLRHWRDGEALFRHAVSVTSGNFLAEYSLGCALAEKNKLVEALAHFTAAALIKPDYGEAHDNRGVVLQMLGKPAEAEAEFAEAVRCKPGLARAHSNLALALQARGRTAEALAEMDQALRLEPDNAQAHNNLGKVFSEQGKFTEAKSEFEKAIRLKPDYAGARVNLGNEFVLGGKLPEAIPFYLAALQVQPDCAEAHLALGLVSGALGKTNDAVQHFSEALRLKPVYPEAHYQLGSLLLNQGKAEEAARHFGAALESRPDYPEAHYQLGMILAGQKQTEAAIAQFREAVRQKPDWLEALNNLAWILATEPDEDRRHGPEAVHLAAHAVELTQTNNAGTLDTLAAAYAQAGRFQEAAETAQRAAQAATAGGSQEMAAEIQKRQQIYEAGRPYRE